MLYLNSVAPKDGTTIDGAFKRAICAALWHPGAASISRDALDRQHHVGLRHLRVLGEVRDHQMGAHVRREFIVGGTGARLQMGPMQTMLKQLFGAKVKVISGYKGGNDVYMRWSAARCTAAAAGSSPRSRRRPDWFPEKSVGADSDCAQRDRNPRRPALYEFVKD